MDLVLPREAPYRVVFPISLILLPSRQRNSENLTAGSWALSPPMSLYLFDGSLGLPIGLYFIDEAVVEEKDGVA